VARSKRSCIARKKKLWLNSTYPDAGYPIANYPDRLGPLHVFVNNSARLTLLVITGYRIKYSTMLWLLEFQIRCGCNVWTQVHIINSNSQITNCQYSLFSKKNPIIQILCISGWLAIPINLEKWRSTVWNNFVFYCGDTQWLSWLRHCATSWKVAGSFPDGVIGFFDWHNPSGRTMALGSTQPLREMSTRNVSWG
jgi:hypothetical protein